jgi:hypothetical protein
LNPKSTRTDMNTSIRDSKKQHSFTKIPPQLWLITDLTAVDFQVFGTIQQYSGANSYCWLGVTALAHEIGRARKTVIASIQKLESASMIRQVEDDRRRKCFSIVNVELWKPELLRTSNSRVLPTGNSQPPDSDAQLLPRGNSQVLRRGNSHCYQEVTDRTIFNRKEKLKEHRKEKIPPDAPSDSEITPPSEWENLGSQAPLYEPDGSHDTNMDNDIDYSYDDTNTEDYSNEYDNSISSTTDNDTSVAYNSNQETEVMMTKKTCTTENGFKSPVSDSECTGLAVISKPPENSLTADDRRELALSQHGESDLRKPKANRYRYFPQHMELARDWAEYGTYEMPSLRVNLEAWANELRLIEENDKFSMETLRAMLEFVVKDSFWKPNALSVMGLRKEGKNGMRKLENIKNAMRNSRSFKEKSASEALISDDFSVKQEHRFSFEQHVENDDIPF